jgi:MSHA biogenesis protein MshO
LIELVVVIAISAVLGGLVTSFVARPLAAYSDARLRADLVDMAENASRRVARDVRAALPNSLRVSADGRGLELLHTADGGRYRDAAGTNPSSEDHGAASDVLAFTGDTQWNLLGRFGHLPFSYGSPLPAGTRVAIYTTGASVWTDAATDANPGVITPGSTSITLSDDGDEDQISLSGSHEFRFASPRQRLFVVDEPISYLCNTVAGTLVRYGGYSPAGTQPTNPAASPLATASSALVVNGVSGCEFSYDPGTATRAGLLAIAITLAKQDEQVSLFHQVHLTNAP